MITKNYKNTLDKPLILEKYANIDKILFFDIETTGLSADSSFVYLISYGFFKNEHFFLTQLFAENMNEELKIIKAFDEILPDFTLLAQFNGNNFDIPYLKKRAERHSYCSNISTIEYFDIYLNIKEFKKLLCLDNCKLKTVEKLLRLKRNDLIDGGEAINEYYNYISCGNTESLNACLLHNYEDVLNLPEISKLLIFQELKNIDGYNIDLYTDNNQLILLINISDPIDLEFICEYEDIKLIFEKNKAKLIFKIENDNVKLHYSQYKNYCFLEAEGYAVEASYANSIGLKKLKRCTLKNSYQPVNIDSVIENKENAVLLWNETYNWLLLRTKNK